MESTFDNFITQVGRADVRITPIIDEDETPENSHPDDTEFQIMFNDTETFKKFRLNVHNLYMQSCVEIENQSSNYNLKGDYLIFLRRKLRVAQEVKHFFNAHDNTLAYPETFSITNVDTDESTGKFSVSDFNQYFQLQTSYIDRIIKSINDLINVTLSLKSEEISLKPPAKILDPHDPTPDKPLTWFNYLISENGISKIKNEFYPQYTFPNGPDHPYYPGYFDEKKEAYFDESYDYESGDVYETVIYFKDELKRTLTTFFNKTVVTMESKVTSYIPDRKAISDYLLIQLNDMDRLISQIPGNKLLTKYEDITKASKGIIRRLIEKYYHFLPDDMLKKFADYHKLSIHDTPVQKLIWTDTAKAFVEFYGPLIKEEKIQLNGKSLTSPIVSQLHNFFVIEKDNKKGNLSVGSLQTYFKNYNSENAGK